MRASEFLSEVYYYSKDAKNYEKRDAYFKRLEKQKISQLGKGLYARVFQHPTYSNVVVKVFYRDGGYERYLKFILSNPQNRYVPQIIPANDKKLVHSATMRDAYRMVRDWNFVFMKKYNTATADQLYNLFRQWNAISGQTKFFSGKNSQDIAFIAADARNWTNWANSTALKRKDPDAWALANFFKQNWKYLDLHSRNYMWDPENQTVVFTDPMVD